jgi:hypothetical protein
VTRKALSAGLAAIFLILCPSAAVAQADLSALYKQILQNPQDTELNLRYAKAAEEQGNPQRALAALERVVVNDPDNETAKSELARLRTLVAQPETRYLVSVGALYETNMPRHADFTTTDIDDFGLYLKGGVSHQRTIGGRRYIFDGQIYTRWNDDFDAGQLDFIGGQAAPIFYAFGGWQVTPGLGLAYARLDRDPFFGSIYLFANFDNTNESIWRQVRVRAGIDDYDNFYAGRDAAVFAGDTTFVWTSVMRGGDLVLVRPEFTYNGARADPSKFYDLTLRTIYAVPIPGIEIPNVKSLTGVAYLTLQRRSYEAQTAAILIDRRDYKYNPGLQVIFNDVYRPGFSITAGWGYENNHSNLGFGEYHTHTVSVSGTWRF